MQRGSDPQAALGRHYGMDWLRIGAFQLLILYHVSMVFVPWDYHVKLASIEWMTLPMFSTAPWRLSLLFVVSGYASAAILARNPGPGAFFRQRLLRLGIPLLFGTAVIVTPQPWVQLVTQRGYQHGFGYFLTHDYLSFRKLGGIPLPNWMQLWFVAYLLAYTAILAIALKLPQRLRDTLGRAAERLFAGPQLLVIGIGFVWWTRMRFTPMWEDTHNFFDDQSAHACYFGMFVFGIALRRSPTIMACVVRLLVPSACLAVAAFATLVTLALLYSGTAPLPDRLQPILWAARAIETWCAIVALIALAERFANVDHRWRQPLAEAVFPFYIIHQTIILLVAYWLIGTGFGPLAHFLILIATTAAGCWIFYLAGRTIPWLRPLIGLNKRTKTGTASATRPS
jgi:glucans biosynthesis protein C